MITKQIAVKGWSVVTQISRRLNNRHVSFHYSHLRDQGLRALAKGSSVAFLPDDTYSPPHYGTAGTLIRDFRITTAATVNDTAPGARLAGVHQLRWIPGVRKHVMEGPDGNFEFSDRTADGKAISLPKNTKYFFHLVHASSGQAQVAKVELHPDNRASETGIIPPRVARNWSRTQEVGGRTLLHVGEFDAGDLPIWYLLQHTTKLPMHLTIGDLLSACRGYAKLVSEGRRDWVEYGLESDNKRAKEVLKALDTADTGGAKLDMLVNPKVFGANVWEIIINSSLSKPDWRDSAVECIHMLHTVDIGTTVANIPYVNAFKERLAARRRLDHTHKRTLVTGVAHFLCKRQVRGKVTTQFEEELGRGHKYAITTYKKQAAPVEHPTVASSSWDTLYDGDDRGMKVLQLDCAASGVKVAYRKTDGVEAMRQIKAMLATAEGARRVTLHAEDETRCLPGFVHWVLNVSPAQGDTEKARRGEATDAEQLALWIAKRLNAENLGGMFFAITTKRFYSEEAVQVLLDEGLKMDPGIARRITDGSMSYPLGFQTLKVFLDERMVSDARVTRKLENICKNVNKLSAKAKPNTRGGGGQGHGHLPDP